MMFSIRYFFSRRLNHTSLLFYKHAFMVFSWNPFSSFSAEFLPSRLLLHTRSTTLRRQGQYNLPFAPPPIVAHSCLAKVPKLSPHISYFWYNTVNCVLSITYCVTKINKTSQNHRLTI